MRNSMQRLQRQAQRSIILALAALLMIAATLAALAPTPAGSAEQDRQRIALVLFRGCEDACEGFLDYLRRRQVAVGVSVYDADMDASRIPDFVRQIKADPPDLVVTWGTTTAQTVFGTLGAIDPDHHVTAIPGLFMIVSQPVGSGMIAEDARPRPGLTGTAYLADVGEQLDTLERYLAGRPSGSHDRTPGPSRIGVLFTPTETNAQINVALLTEEATRRGIAVDALALPLDAHGAPLADTIPALVATLAGRGVDVIYQGADSFLNVHRQPLTAAALAHDLPVLSAGEAPIRSGHALLGVVHRYHDVGRLTARIAVQILAGVDPASIPVKSPENPALLVNAATADALDLPPPPELAPFIEFVDCHCFGD